MGKRIRIADHLRVEELEARYRGETDGRARTHWQMLWLLVQGHTTKEVALVTGYTPQWIRMLVQRYNEQGPDSLQDRRHHNPGAARVLNPAQEAELDTALDGPSPDGGLWTGPKVAHWINERVERPITNYGGWLYLRRLPRRLRVPRPQHTQSDSEAQATFKKKLPELIRQIHADHPGLPIETWAFDEHRIGLKSIRRRIWARRGQRPIAPVRDRYQWMYLHGFVHPATGNTSWWLMPTVRIAIFRQVLAAFAQEVGAGPEKVVVLVLDRAGWHTSTKVRVPNGMYLVFLPAYSPELQPAERLWPLTNEPLANRTFTTLQELEAVQSERCRILVAQSPRVQALTAFHWWPCIE